MRGWVSSHPDKALADLLCARRAQSFLEDMPVMRDAQYRTWHTRNTRCMVRDAHGCTTAAVHFPVEHVCAEETRTRPPCRNADCIDDVRVVLYGCYDDRLRQVLEPDIHAAWHIMLQGSPIRPHRIPMTLALLPSASALRSLLVKGVNLADDVLRFDWTTLRACSQLNALSICLCQLDNEALESIGQFAAQCTRLETLIVMLPRGMHVHLSRMPFVLAHVLLHTTSLLRLYLSHIVTLGNPTPFFAAVGANSTLQVLRLQMHILDCRKGVITTMLGTNTTLRSLDMAMSLLKKDACNELAAIVRASSTLKTLNLFNVHGCPAAFPSLMKAIGANTSIASLDLGRIIRDPRCEFANSLQPLVHNQTIRTLRVFQARMSNSLRDTLAQIVRASTTLQALILAGSHANDDDMTGIGDALAESHSLQTLDMCIASDDAQRTIMAGLQRNTSLTTLTLRTHDVAVPCDEYLCSVLRANTALLALKCVSHTIHAASLTAVCLAATEHVTLRSLRVDSKRTRGTVDVQQLAGAFQRNTTLTEVKLPADVASSVVACAGTRAALQRNVNARRARHSMAHELTAAWVRAQRTSDPRYPLCALPHELLRHIVACMSISRRETPLRHWTPPQRASMWLAARTADTAALHSPRKRPRKRTCDAPEAP